MTDHTRVSGKSEPRNILQQPSDDGAWVHGEEGDLCDAGFVSARPEPPVGQWWCTEHQKHLVWVEGI